MKRVLLTLMLAAALLLPAPLTALDPPFASIRKLDVGDRGSCTTGSINRDKHYWITAGHCVWDHEHGWITRDPLVIDGDSAIVVLVNLTHDVAVLRTKDLSAKALKLAKRQPDWGDDLFIFGFPYGYGPFWVKGGFAAPYFEKPGEYAFNLPVCPGNSGSPVLNRRGEIISVLQFALGPFCSPISGGVSLPVLRTILVDYVE